jgi:penicillin-binding protein 1C
LRLSDNRPEPVPLKVNGAVFPLTILVNGMPAPPQSHGPVFFRPPGPGFARVTVIDGSGTADSVMLRFDAGAQAMAVPPGAPPGCAVTPCAHP